MATELQPATMTHPQRKSAAVAAQKNQRILAPDRTSSKTKTTADESDIDPSLLTVNTDIVAEHTDEKTYNAKIEKIRTKNDEFEYLVRYVFQRRGSRNDNWITIDKIYKILDNDGDGQSSKKKARRDEDNGDKEGDEDNGDKEGDEIEEEGGEGEKEEGGKEEEGGSNVLADINEAINLNPEMGTTEYMGQLCDIQKNCWQERVKFLPIQL